MKNKGFTLIELMVTILISGIVGLAMVYHFVAEYRFRTMIGDDIDVTREARIAVNHMTRILRFAKPSSVVTNGHSVGAIIDGHHLDLIGTDTNVFYIYDDGDDTLSYQIETNPSQVIANNVSSFKSSWNNPELTLKLKFSRGKRDISIETLIKTIGE